MSLITAQLLLAANDPTKILRMTTIKMYEIDSSDQNREFKAKMTGLLIQTFGLGNSCATTSVAVAVGGVPHEGCATFCPTGLPTNPTEELPSCQ